MGSTFWHKKPAAKFCTASLLLSVCIFLIHAIPQKTTPLVERTLVNTDSEPDRYDQRDGSLHILLPATKRDVNLCKTVVTMTILDYPSPSIVGWGAADTTDHMRGGGSHCIKIEKVLEYLSLHQDDPGFDDELVLVLDSYDIWFQLPLEVLINRYHFTIAKENARTAQRMGRAFEKESIDSLSCLVPGNVVGPTHTATCQVIPESPLPHDLYGADTDTALGHNQWTGHRTRYLNSGYMIGPAKSMRALLQRAQDKLDVCRDRTEAAFDDGSGTSDLCYHGSDQSIFAEMYGDQEHHRNLMRQHYKSRWDGLLSSVGSEHKHITWQAESDIGHEYLPGKPYEFGIALDYWSSIGHQTMNAQHDTEFLRYNQSDTAPLTRESELDCQMTRPKLEGSIDEDLWAGRPLYSEVCISNVPVMIHHNDVDKSHREEQWNQTWWHGSARQLLQERRGLGDRILNEGIQTDNDTQVSWEELCPSTYESELFRDTPEEGGHCYKKRNILATPKNNLIHTSIFPRSEAIIKAIIGMSSGAVERSSKIPPHSTIEMSSGIDQTNKGSDDGICFEF